MLEELAQPRAVALRQRRGGLGEGENGVLGEQLLRGVGAEGVEGEERAAHKVVRRGGGDRGVLGGDLHGAPEEVAGVVGGVGGEEAAELLEGWGLEEVDDGDDGGPHGGRSRGVQRAHGDGEGGVGVPDDGGAGGG